MQTYKKGGFTLIELLVVVLIIGILAAVALPQYRLAVEKSQFTQAIILGKHIAEQKELFYLANGFYPNTWEELSMTSPSIKNWTFDISQNINVYAGRGEGAMLRFFAQHHAIAESQNLAGKYVCVARSDIPLKVQLCKSISGKTEGKHYPFDNSHPYIYFELN